MPIAERPEDLLDTDVQFVKGVGPKLAQLLAKAKIHTVRDLLFYLPRRYDDRRNMPPLGKLRAGQQVSVRGRLIGLDARPVRGGKVVLKATINDGTGSLALTWFNQPWVRKRLEEHRGEIVAFGMVKESGWSYEMANPEYELIEEDAVSEAFARIVPVYPLTEGLPQWLVRRAVAAALERFGGAVKDGLPEWMRRDFKLRPLGWSLRQVHQPEDDELRQQARRRLVFEEFLLMQIRLELLRRDSAQAAGIAFDLKSLGRDELMAEAAAMLPFQLTGAQSRVIAEIWADMERPHPMHRLLQGDVGSGKTAVAACAMLAAVRCGYQAALMAPTEILAEQHHRNLRELFEPLGIRVELLVGKQSKSTKRAVRERARMAEAQIAVGTHALIQEDVAFDKLGLVVIDEQHRFGVLQRAALRDKGAGIPDVLVMTATPIPRTLTMTVYGDLDLSVIDELPPGRKAIKTHWRPLAARDKVYQQVRELIAQGRQAYFVCPLVSESEKLQALAAQDLHYRLQNEVYPDLRVGLLHGQMKPAEKELVVEQFRAHELDVLVSTTVIEVGVDVPNASVMVIEDANRFGLAQLHQLRGRVGRGSHQSFCVLLADAKSEDAEARVNVMLATTDGFVIAEEDLRLRGPGDMMGTRQSGLLDLDIADIVQDSAQLEVARQAAKALLDKDPDLTAPEHRPLRAALERSVAKLPAVAIG